MRRGTFGSDPYEWTDDTSMAIALAEGLNSLRSSPSAIDETHALKIPDSVLDKIVNRWYEWSIEAKDVGIQTGDILRTANRERGAFGRGIKAEDVLLISKRYHERNGKSGGNGSLMRTAPLALFFLPESSTSGDAEEATIESALMEAAFRVSSVTHWDRDTGEACGIWCIAIRHAVLTGELDIRRALKRPKLFVYTDATTGEQVVDDFNKRVALWESRITVAEASRPSAFLRNGWVVEAFQGAWSAIHHARAMPYTSTMISAQSQGDHPGLNPFRLTLELAIRGGNDTDTVAAIAGGLGGAVYGADIDFIPQDWREKLYGWPDMKVEDLIKLVDGLVGSPANLGI